MFRQKQLLDEASLRNTGAGTLGRHLGGEGDTQRCLWAEATTPHHLSINYPVCPAKQEMQGSLSTKNMVDI